MSNREIIQNAVKRYGDFTALNGVSLDIQEGEFFTLLGPSGFGKTTLLRMIAGFNSIEGGDFYFGEKRINDVPAHKRDIGMVFQNYAIFPHLTVRKNVEFGLKNKKLPKAQIAEQTDKFMKLMQIDQYADRLPERLSGGQQQRVALARALVVEPSRTCCSSTSSSPTWTQSSGWRCAPSSRTSSTPWASPPSMSPTTRRRPWPSPTGSPS